MSQEQFKAFTEAVKTDAALQAKLQAAAEAEAVIDLAKTAGFTISAEDLQEIELSDEQLEQVVGGIGLGTAFGIGVMVMALIGLPLFDLATGGRFRSKSDSLRDQLSDPSAFNDISVG